MKKTYIERILTARVYDVAVETPLQPMKRLSKRMLNQVLLKREDMQPVFSFKIRGAYNKMFHLSQAQRDKGVITASAGNHAQGVAMSGSHLGIKTVIVMPRTTPDIKVKSVRALGGQAVLRGDSYDEAYAYAKELAAEKSYTYVHPYDDVDVIAGQGTVAMELIRQHPEEIDVIFVPVGGGGLLAGIAAFIKHIRPNTKIVAVEPEDAACFKLAFDSGRRKTLDQVGIFADGVAVRQIGEEPWAVAKDLVDAAITVSTDEICAAIKDIFDDNRAIAEPAGALAVAGLKKYVTEQKVEGKNLIAINSGANINFDRLRHVAERAELGEGREMLMSVTIDETPGAFLAFAKVLGKRRITEFNYRYSSADKAHIFVGIETTDSDERSDVIAALVDAGLEVEDLSDNEMAKIHVRYMVGGHTHSEQSELLYRFQFPERPGALVQFLSKMGKRWNISMFHYRNHGSAFGRVLMAVQADKTDRAELEKRLSATGYDYWEEGDNPAFKLFLR